ncbi:MAG: MaoC family dehydratase [Chloroflexi bacterium]|nr:MaoC family dehydratase [Chloroflexota bacterium]
MEDTAIDLGSWQITADAAREYLNAVGDELPVYRDTGIAPPLMLTARVVGLLLDHLSLPDGAIHSLQDVETVRAPRIGITAATTARVDPPRERGGLRFLTVNYSVTDADSGAELQRGRTTVLLPPSADGAANGNSNG